MRAAYELSGSKVFCTRGAEADVVLVMARTGGPGPKGVSAFLVEQGTVGFFGSKKEDKMGWRSSPTWQLILDKAPVPEARRLGKEGDGFKIALAALDSGRLGMAACAVGLGQAAFDAALEFTKEREQFGRPVADNQGIRFMLADMATGIEAGRALYRHAARMPRRAARLFTPGGRGQAFLHRHGDASDNRRGAAPRRLWLRHGVPGRAFHARCEGPADRGGNQPDPAPHHRAQADRAAEVIGPFEIAVIVVVVIVVVFVLGRRSGP